MWSETTWPIDSLPQLLNPSSGYVFNTNNTPYSSSDTLDNPKILNAHKTMHYLDPAQENNRSLRLQELIDDQEVWSYEDFKKLKYDRTYPTPLKSQPYDEEPLLQQVSDDTSLGEAMKLLQAWDRSTQQDNETAPLFLLAKEELRKIYLEHEVIKSEDYSTAISNAVDSMLTSFGSFQVPLGEFQRHRRGDVDLPLGGGGDVLAAIYSRSEEDGKYRAYSGESYIQLVRFDPQDGPILETVNAFGASAEKDSPHYTDQMKMFVNQELKEMRLNLSYIQSNSSIKYHPRALKREDQ